jgi:hypothetical protein
MIKKKITIILFFVILLFIGLNSYKKFGLSVDEPEIRMRAAETALFIVGKFSEVFNIEIEPIKYKTNTIEKYIQPNFDFKNWTDYSFHGGVSLALPAFVIERIFLDYFPKKNIWFLWHLINFLFFYISIIFFYLLTTKFFKNWKIGLLASLMLILSPRILAESFYNSKDIIFMSTFIITTFSLINVSKKTNFKNIIIHGFMTGFLIDLRIMGIIVWLPTFILVLKNYLKKKISYNKFLITLLVYFLSCIITIFLFWPELWPDIKVFFLTLKRLAKFTCGETLFMGKFIDTCNLPFSYIFIWISYTTPIIFLLLFILGFCYAFFNQFFFWLNFLKKKKFITDQKLHELVFLFFLLTPIMAVIILNSTLYDGWRHLYFIYPFMIIFAAKGIVQTIKIAPLNLNKNFLFLIFFLFFLQILNWNIVNFPYGNVFFNSLAGKNLRDKFELDYWGLANRQALERIVNNDNNEKIIIVQDSLNNLSVSLQMLDYKDSKRITIVDKTQFDLDTKFLNNFKINDNSIYRINNYKNVKNPYDITIYKDYKLYYEIMSGNEKILTIYKK